MTGKRTTNAGNPWDVTVTGRGTGRALLEVETEKHLIRFEIDWYNIQCLTNHLWEFIDKEQDRLNRVKANMRGPA